uniref:Pentatricopeptide repeat-containing protein n=1 Tax=Timema monikensis TaxID=170555 RepID=A0A7R9E613_9NEOP|nr:unnamed protein product [Timema monikensis]
MPLSYKLGDKEGTVLSRKGVGGHSLVIIEKTVFDDSRVRQSELEPTAATYSALLQGYATVGDVAGLQETYQKAANAHIALSEKQILEVLKCAVITGHRNLMTHIIKWLPILDMETGTIASNLAIHLVHLGHEEAAFALLDILPTPPTGSKEEAAGIGSFLLREAVVADRPLSTVVKLCDRLMADGRNTLALTKIAHVCLGTERVESSLVVFKAMLERGLKLRPHYFWPIFLTNARLLGEKGVFYTIQHMTDLGVALDFDTLAHYVLPHVSLADPPMLVRKLQGCGMTVGALLTPVLATLLRQGRVGPAGKLFETTAVTTQVIKVSVTGDKVLMLYVSKSCEEGYAEAVKDGGDEALFCLCGQVNSQNTRIRATQHLHAVREAPLHTVKVGDWYSGSKVRIFTPIFFDWTVNTNQYTHMIMGFIGQVDDIELYQGYFYQDINTYQLQELVATEIIISDFFLKEIVYVTCPCTLDNLKEDITLSSLFTLHHEELSPLFYWPAWRTMPRPFSRANEKLTFSPIGQGQASVEGFSHFHLNTCCRDFLMFHHNHIAGSSSFPPRHTLPGLPHFHLDTRCRDFLMFHHNHIAGSSSFPPRHTLPRPPHVPSQSRCGVFLISYLDTRCQVFLHFHLDTRCRDFLMFHHNHIAGSSSFPPRHMLPGLPHFLPRHTLPGLPHFHLDTRCRDLLMPHRDHIAGSSSFSTSTHVAGTSSCPTVTHIFGTSSCPIATHVVGTFPSNLFPTPTNTIHENGGMFKGSLESDRLLKPLVSSYHLTKDVPSIISMLKLMATSQRNDWPGQFLLEVLTSKKNKTEPEQFWHIIDATIDWSLFTKLFYQNTFRKEGLHISSFSCESICHNLPRTPSMDSYTEKVKESLEALVDLELGIINSELFSQLIPHPEFEAAGHEFSAGMIACMFDAHVRFGSLEEAEAYFKELTTSAPSFTLDHFKVVDFATLLVTKGKLKDAVSLLNKYPANIRGKGSLLSISRNCLRLLTAMSKSGEGAASTRDMLNLLVKQGYCAVNNIMLGPLIRAHLNSDDLPGAVSEFKRSAVEHGCTPLQHELLCQLVVEAEKGPTGQALLQETIKAGQQVHRIPSTHIALIVALAETGQEKQLRRLLMVTCNTLHWIDNIATLPAWAVLSYFAKRDPSVKINSSLLLARCQRLVDEDKLEPLHAIVSSTYNNANFNNTPIFTYMLQIFKRRGDCDGALSLWTSMQERDIQPPPQFMDQLAALLHSHKRAVPFITSADYKVQSDTAAT